MSVLKDKQWQDFTFKTFDRYTAQPDRFLSRASLDRFLLKACFKNNTSEINDGGVGHNFSLCLFQKEEIIDSWIYKRSFREEMFCEISQLLK